MKIFKYIKEKFYEAKDFVSFVKSQKKKTGPILWYSWLKIVDDYRSYKISKGLGDAFNQYIFGVQKGLQAGEKSVYGYVSSEFFLTRMEKCKDSSDHLFYKELYDFSQRSGFSKEDVAQKATELWNRGETPEEIIKKITGKF